MANLADLEGVVDRLDGPFDLLAFAGGGYWSILYAARHPERVRRLVLWSTPVEPFKPSQRQHTLQALTAPTLVKKDVPPAMGRRHARTILSPVPNAQLFRLEEFSSRY